MDCTLQGSLSWLIVLYVVSPLPFLNVATSLYFKHLFTPFQVLLVSSVSYSGHLDLHTKAMQWYLTSDLQNTSLTFCPDF